MSVKIPSSAGPGAGWVTCSYITWPGHGARAGQAEHSSQYPVKFSSLLILLKHWRPVWWRQCGCRLLYCWRAEHIYVTAGLVGCWGWALGHTYQSFDMTICEEGGGGSCQEAAALIQRPETSPPPMVHRWSATGVPLLPPLSGETRLESCSMTH